MADADATTHPDPLARARFHMRLGFAALTVFASVGLVLEGMHGFKVAYYLDATNETRRLMWRLGHAHGVLLALVNVAFGVTLHVLALRLGSRALLAASLLLPVGFLAAGFGVYGGDPGWFIALVPLGGGVLVLGLAAIAWGLRGEA